MKSKMDTWQWRAGRALFFVAVMCAATLWAGLVAYSAFGWVPPVYSPIGSAKMLVITAFLALCGMYWCYEMRDPDAGE